MESVKIASLYKGPFSVINIRVVDDTKGELGRSKARNLAVEGSDADWIFFLDADDRIHPDAFMVMHSYLGYDAVWGNILEFVNGVCFWRYQVPHINTYEELLTYDPYKTIGPMGHFVKAGVAKALPFDEEMDCGEDWDFYLREWKSYTCIKQRQPFIINYRQEHSTGPRSATGRDWMNIVHPMLDRARHALHAGEIVEKGGYWFPKTDQHFTKATFELDHIPVCLEHCKQQWNAIDIGAHVGGWSKELAKHFHHVWSYEPEETNHKCLKKNLEGIENISTFRLALGDKESTGKIINDDYSNSGSGWLEDGEDFAVTTLDKHLGDMDNVDFIKVDVEGLEYHVLMGAEGIVKKNKPAILIEMKPQFDGRYGQSYIAAGELLEEWGYRLAKKLNKNYLYVMDL